MSTDLRAAFQAALATADPADPAAVIRAAVDVVLPEEEDLPRYVTVSECPIGLTNDYLRQSQRRRTRAKFLALADAIQQVEGRADA